MRVLVIGSKDWVDYNSVMRNLTVLIEDIHYKYPDEKKIVFVHSGGVGAETMSTEYIGKVEKYMRQKGYSLKEEVVFSKNVSNNAGRMAVDYDMITSGIDEAIVFSYGQDRRADYCIKILREMNVPTKVVKDK